MTRQSKDKLNIALMIETVIMGGAEMVVLQLAQELRARGHTVHPVVPANREGWLLDRFRESGFEWHTYDLRRPIDLSLPPRLAGMLKDLDIDVVHSHEFVMAVYGAAAARRLGIPHIITMHGNQTMTQKLNRRVALRWAFRRSTSTIAVSQDTRRHLNTSLGLRNGAIGVIPNGVPFRQGDRARLRRELGIGEFDLLLLSVGNLIPRKGHAYLLQALAALLDKKATRRKWQLVIAGEGPERENLTNIIRERNLTGRVHLLGLRNDIADLQAAADVFVMPSVWEGLPLAVLEAMFAGNAVIASNISGIPEAIQHERDGLLTPPADEAALEAALGRIINDDELRLRLGQTALDRANREFTIATMTDAYERLYRKPA